MRRFVRSQLPSIATLALLVCAQAASGIDPYTATDHENRKRVALDEERVDLDLSIVYLDPPNSPTNKYSTYAPLGQLVALLCELEAQADGLSHPGGGGTEVDDEEADDHLAAAIAEIFDIIGGTVLDPQPDELDGSNLHSALDAGLFAAYILHRFPDASSIDTEGGGWSASTLAAAQTLFKHGNWPYAPAIHPELIENSLSNNPGSNLAMRLLAAEVFDDDDMMQRVRYEYANARATLARRGLSEPHAPHYGGRVIRQLLLAWQTHDPTLRQWIQDLLEMQLVAAGHTYLPGGGLGAPHQRDKDGAITDPSLTKSSHLIQQINMLINDPALLARLPSVGQPGFKGTYSAWTLATDYHPPEIIRSVFLDKGEGYEYLLHSMDSWLSNNGCCGKNYESTGWQGWNPDAQYDGEDQSETDGTTHLTMQPGHAAMLASGKASIGGSYGYSGNKSPSWGAYVENPNVPQGYSILYQHQPRDDRKNGTAWDPIDDDPKWKYERKTPYRRMSFHNTQIALYDVSYVPETGEDQELDYTIAHVPAFLAQCAGSDWWVGQATAGGPYLAYHPLGEWEDTEGTPADASAEPFTLVTLTDPISGYVAEIAEAADHTDEAAYCTALASRTLDFTGIDAASAELEVDAPDAEGTLQTITLEYEPETRWIGTNQLDDVETFGAGLIGSPMATWSEVDPDDTQRDQFTLLLDRDDLAPEEPAYGETRKLEFGDPTMPTPPIKFKALSHEDPGDPVRLRWDHGFDDTGIDSYPVLRNGDVIATIDASESMAYDDDDLCPAAQSYEVTDTATYVLRSDAQSDVSLDTYPISVEVLGDVTRPSTPTGVVSVATSPTQAVGWWNAASDNWGIYAYWVNRREVGSQDPPTKIGTNQTWFVHDGLEPDTSYEYWVESIDLCARLSDPSPVKIVTTPSP